MTKERQPEKRALRKRPPATAPGGHGDGWALKTRDGIIVTRHSTQIEAVMAAAGRSGLLRGKSGRIGGRVSPLLVEKAKARTGIETDTDLIQFALANLALEDGFAEAFKAVRGTVDPDLELGS